MRLTLRVYQDGDEAAVAARADFAEAFAAQGRLPDGRKWTLVSAGRVVGVAGLEPLGDGCWGAWAYLAELSPRQWVIAVYLARSVLVSMWAGLRARCIQAVPAEHPGAARVLAAMGFRAGAHPRLFVMGDEAWSRP